MTYWLNDDSRTFLSRGYLSEGQSAEERIHEIVSTASKYLGSHVPDFYEVFTDFVMRGWVSFSTPVWINFGNKRGLPISCNGSYIPDTTAGILEKAAEIGMMTKHGAGTSAYFGALRPRGSSISAGGESSGPVHFMELTQTIIDVISQGNARRGNCAVTLPVEHPDIREFLQAREEGSAIQRLSLGVTVTNEWMNQMISGDNEKRELWLRIIRKRSETGYPYIFFTDNLNNHKDLVAPWYKEYPIYASNLCQEIALPSSEDESFVCCLASVNLLHFDEWKDTKLVKYMIYFLDSVMQEYIDKTANLPFMKAAHTFAKRHRALGLGVLGWHSYLQRNSVAFESFRAKNLNVRIWQRINAEATGATAWLAKWFGECEVAEGYGVRNTTLLAVAPTTSSSFILGQVSPSIEPLHSNYFVKDLAKGKFTYRNPYLAQVLETYDKNTEEVWRDILLRGGSVQHLDFLTEHEKNVFKTFGEISQMDIVIQAAQRQTYIDQAQSLNLMIHPDTSVKDINALMIEAWRNGVKTLYYQRSTNPAQELGRVNILECSSCES